MKPPATMERVRIDKWVWAARFFKTRSLAAQAVQKGRIMVGGATVKTAREVRLGDSVTVEIDGFVWDVRVTGVSDMRGPASVARTLYEETEAGRARREAEASQRRLFKEPGALRDGRPTKRERRTIEKAGFYEPDAG